MEEAKYMKIADGLQQKAYDLLFKNVHSLMKEAGATERIAFEVYLNAVCLLAAKLNANEEALVQSVREGVAHFKSKDAYKNNLVN
jgi:hypothetical protein